MHDVIIVGGGPAGLSAALLLGRCNRRVLVCDSGQYRNARSRGVHGFLSRDGALPGELLRISREQLAPYDVELLRCRVEQAARIDRGFALTLQDGRRLTGRKLLLATGIVDILPPIPGLDALWGTGALACPYCDGWELRGQPLAVYGAGASALALALKTWSEDVVYLTDGEALADDDAASLRDHGVALEPTAVRRFVGDDDGRLEHVELADGRRLARAAVFVKHGRRQSSDLAAQLGVPVDDDDGVARGRSESTSITGVYVAGDASCDRLFAIIAAAEGVTAALAIHDELRREDHQR